MSSVDAGYAWVVLSACFVSLSPDHRSIHQSISLFEVHIVDRRWIHLFLRSDFQRSQGTLPMSRMECFDDRFFIDGFLLVEW